MTTTRESIEGKLVCEICMKLSKKLFLSKEILPIVWICKKCFTKSEREVVNFD